MQNETCSKHIAQEGYVKMLFCGKACLLEGELRILARSQHDMPAHGSGCAFAVGRGGKGWHSRAICRSNRQPNIPDDLYTV
jgi:hypothetical protein